MQGDLHEKKQNKKTGLCAMLLPIKIAEEE